MPAPRLQKSWCMNPSNYRFIQHIHDMWHSSSILGIIIMGILNPINGYITIPFYGTCSFFLPTENSPIREGRVNHFGCQPCSICSGKAFARQVFRRIQLFEKMMEGRHLRLLLYIISLKYIYVYTFYVYIYIYLFDM